MRIFAAILSVYILVLSGIACEDHHANDFASGSISLEWSADMHNHSGVDICNPFFFCHVGHHTFVGEEINKSILVSGQVEILKVIKPEYHFTLLIPIWNPPKAKWNC